MTVMLLQGKAGKRHIFSLVFSITPGSLKPYEFIKKQRWITKLSVKAGRMTVKINVRKSMI
ncbi:MAG: hypothetical protein ACKOXB_12560 [Flavobacteriales bacterium]